MPNARIDPDLSKQVQEACAFLAQAYSEKNLRKSLEAFLNSNSVSDATTYTFFKGSWGTKLEANKGSSLPSAATIGRAIGTRQGSGINENMCKYLEKLLREYVVYYQNLLAQKELNAPAPAMIQVLVERASGMCSKCLSPTIGPDQFDARKSVRIGIATPINGLDSKDRRHDKKKSSDYLNSVENYIWLCPTCRASVDANDGYTATMLHEWKSTHEDLMRLWRDGRKRITFQFQGPDKQSKLSRELVQFFAQESQLFVASDVTTYPTTINALKEINSFLCGFIVKTVPDSLLQVHVDILINASNFLSKKYDEGERTVSLPLFRKMIEMSLVEISQLYRIRLPKSFFREAV